MVALVAGLVGFGVGGGAPWGRAGAAESPPPPDYLNAPGRFPARSAFGTSGLYAGATVEISCTAVLK